MLEYNELVGNESVNAFGVTRWLIFLLDIGKSRILVYRNFTKEGLNLAAKVIELGL